MNAVVGVIFGIFSVSHVLRPVKIMVRDLMAVMIVIVRIKNGLYTTRRIRLYPQQAR